MASGWVHLFVALSFLASAFLLDVDHIPSCNFKELRQEFNGNGDAGCERGIFHNPIIFWCLLALTVGLFIHLKLDGLI